MTALEIIEKLHTLGAEIQASGNRLTVHAPVGIVTPELKSAITEHKPEIIEALTTFRPGSIVRPIPVRFNVENPPAECLMDSCTGDLLTRGSLFVCDACGVWYSNAGALTTADLLCLTAPAKPAKIRQISLVNPRGWQICHPRPAKPAKIRQISLEFENAGATVH